MTTLLKRSLLALTIGCGILCIYFLIDWQRDNARLRNFADGVLDVLGTRAVTGRDIVTGREIERLNSRISRTPERKQKPPRAWPKLGPTPIEVMEQGGDCADRSRFLVAVLREYGVAATSVMLAPCDGCPFAHTVVEAKAVDGTMVIDPLFGISFPNPKGGYYGVRNLRDDPSIVPKRLEELAKLNEADENPVRDREYASYFGYPTMINLKKNVFTHWAAIVIAQFADEPELVYRPRFLEDPKLVLTLMAGASSLAALSVCAAIVIGTRRRRAVIDTPPRKEDGERYQDRLQ
jgi:hypothetical protein